MGVSDIIVSEALSSSSSSADTKEVDFEVTVLPSQLRGMDVLWNIALTVPDDAIATRAIRFLNKVHQRLNLKCHGEAVEARRPEGSESLQKR